MSAYRATGRAIPLALTGLEGDPHASSRFLYLLTGWFYALIPCDEARPICPASSPPGGGADAAGNRWERLCNSAAVPQP